MRLEEQGNPLLHSNDAQVWLWDVKPRFEWDSIRQHQARFAPSPSTPPPRSAPAKRESLNTQNFSRCPHAEAAPAKKGACPRASGRWTEAKRKLFAAGQNWVGQAERDITVSHTEQRQAG